MSSQFKSITSKLIKIVFLASASITTLTTCLYLYIDYRTEKEIQQTYLEQLRSAAENALIKKMWELDDDTTFLHIESIFSLNKLINLEVYDSNGELAYSKSSSNVPPRFTGSSHQQLFQSYRNEKVSIGHVQITTNEQIIWLHLIKKMFLNILALGLKAFFVSLFIYYAFKKLLINRLNELAKSLTGFNPEEDSQQNYSPLKQEFNELDILEAELRQLKYIINKELKNEFFKINTILDSAGEGIFATDINGSVQVINKSAVSLMNLQPQKEYNHISDLLPHMDLTEDTFFLNIFDDNKNNKYLKIQSYPCAPNTELYGGHVYVVSDITEKKKNERLLIESLEKTQTALDNKNKFLALISHEIRSPLNGILGFADILKDSELTINQHEYVNIISECGEGLLVIVNSLLNLTESNEEIAIHKKEFNLHKLVSSTLGMFYKACKDKNIALYYSIDSSVPESIHSDPDKIKQVIINITNNAIKFTREGFVKVRVALEKHESNRKLDKITISIQDTGIGIAQDRINEMFHRFSRVHNESQNKIVGSGLGLAITKSIVEKLQGSIMVYSQPHQGTEFKISLPVGEIESPIENSVNKPAEQTLNL